jgi:competence protein ComEC
MEDSLRSLAAIIARHPWIILAAVLLVVFAWALASQRRDPDAGKLRLTVIDVGQGDSLLLQTPSGRAILIDGGGANDEQEAAQTDIGERIVVPFLHYEGISRIDVLVVTHPHGDHVGGLSAVLREEQVGVVLDGTCFSYPSPAYTGFLALVRQKRIPYVHAVRGMHITLDRGVTADVLNPPAHGFIYGTNPDNDTVNNYSAVLRVTYGRTHFLLDGDAENEAEASMLAACPDVSADVLKCGHHGAGNASSDAWLTAVHPRFAAISCGLHNPFGHPNPATLARLAAHDIRTFVTARNGAIAFVSDGKTVIARPFRR